jgi:hypothetical protein
MAVALLASMLLYRMDSFKKLSSRGRPSAVTVAILASFRKSSTCSGKAQRSTRANTVVYGIISLMMSCRTE